MHLEVPTRPAPTEAKHARYYRASPRFTHHRLNSHAQRSALRNVHGGGEYELTNTTAARALKNTCRD